MYRIDVVALPTVTANAVASALPAWTSASSVYVPPTLWVPPSTVVGSYVTVHSLLSASMDPNVHSFEVSNVPTASDACATSPAGGSAVPSVSSSSTVLVHSVV